MILFGGQENEEEEEEDNDDTQVNQGNREFVQESKFPESSE
jgi:hypothetical protein